MKNYYVYAHVFEGGEIFYVGKGKGNRINKKGKGSSLWESVCEGRKHVAVKLAINLTSDEAYFLEFKVITFFKSLGLCKANTSYGGKGVNVPERWWGLEISKSLQGIKRPTGENSKSFKSLDIESITKDYETMSSVELSNKYGVSVPTILSRLKSVGVNIRSSGKAAKSIKCIEDGRIFPSISQAAKTYNVFPSNIRKVLSGRYKKTGGKSFSEV